jgi:hypothetical protein
LYVHFSNADLQQAAKLDEDFDTFEGTIVIYLAGSSSKTNSKPYRLKEFCAIWLLVLCKKNHLTYMLQLLKEHRPWKTIDVHR